MSQGKSDNTRSLNQIVIECVTDDDGSLGWIWSAYALGEDGEITGGFAPTLSALLDSMRDHLRTEGLAP